MRIKKINGYPDYYIREDGVVFSVYKRSRLKLSKDRYGYVKVVLQNKGVIKHTTAHRIVAKTFIHNPENKATVNHKNGIKTDNRASNLEWNTASENHIHAYKFLGRKHPRPFLGKFGYNNPSSKEVIQLTKDGDEIRRYGSMCEAERDGFHHGHISAVCLGHQKTHAGFMWKYA